MSRTVAASLCALAALLLAAPVALAAPRDGLLRTREMRHNDFSSLPKWHAVAQKLPEERKLFGACLASAAACPDRAYAAWREAVKAVENAPMAEKLRRINRYVNSWPYRPDRESWGQEEYWATPSEFLKKSGDSEDFAILKYLTLSLAGVPADSMRIVVSRDLLRNKTHTILAVYDKGEIWILDNFIDAVLPEASVLQYAPLYSVNERARWVHVQRSGRPTLMPNP
jgi:predicted transglutaminase-like cysteine proteinase